MPDNTSPGLTTPAALISTINACTAIGNFTAPEARRFSSQLAEFSPNVSTSRHEVNKVSRYQVHLSSLGSKEAADKKAIALRDRGITDFFVI
ncbi:MAG: hypothetical protein H7240_10510 [Glaciimonas sp.]|nr:hypothetical protein [Glaciimonas sp.]